MLLESALSGTDAGVPALARDYVHRVRDAASAVDKIALYAAAVADVGVRMAPVQLVLAGAAQTDPERAALRAEITFAEPPTSSGA